jgi:riboflavin biosynthesis pyrimidine reductase
VLCEGGPTLNGALLGEGVVDELFLTISPLLADRPAPLTIVEAAGLDEPVSLELVWVLEAEGMLFLRYALVR